MTTKPEGEFKTIDGAFRKTGVLIIHITSQSSVFFFDIFQPLVFC